MMQAVRAGNKMMSSTVDLSRFTIAPSNRPFASIAATFFSLTFLCSIILSRARQEAAVDHFSWAKKPPIYAEQPIDQLDFAYREMFHESPVESFARDQMTVREATEEHTATVIVLHGLGDTHQSTWHMMDNLQDNLPHIKWVAPTARIMNVTVREFAPTSAWFDITTFFDLYENEDFDGMVESSRQIHQLINEEREIFINSGRPSRIIIAGFSQGAVMSLLCSLTAKTPLQGATMLSGYLPLVRDAAIIAPLSNRRTPVFWGHGKQDPWISPGLASANVATLRSPPFSFPFLTYKLYEGLGHMSNMDELEDVAAWFQHWLPKDVTSHSREVRSPAEEEERRWASKISNGYFRRFLPKIRADR